MCDMLNCRNTCHYREGFLWGKQVLSWKASSAVVCRRKYFFRAYLNSLSVVKGLDRKNPY